MTPSPIVEYLRYAVPLERGDDFVAAYATAAEPLLASAYCLSFDLCRCVEDGSRYILRIEWTSADDHLQRFRGSDEFRAFFAHVRPWLDDIEEMRHYERLVARSREDREPRVEPT